MSSSDNLVWSPVAVLPNLEVTGEFGNGFAIICSVDNGKMQHILSSFPKLRDFSERFSDAFGVKEKPAFILFNEKFGNRHKDGQALLAFRNLLAVSTASEGLCHAIESSSTFWLPIWTDTFECYPWMLDNQLEDLTVRTPALSGFHKVEHFNGQSSPQLTHRQVSASRVSSILSLELLKRWTDTFVRRRRVRENLIVFRALEMAFSAGIVPYQYVGTDSDAGRSIALWISAFEILSRTGNSMHVGLNEVLKVLDQYDCACSEVRRKRYSIKYKNSIKRVDLIEKTYRSMYSFRNDYLHGNPRSSASLVPDGYNMGIQYAAPALFRMALFSKLQIHAPKLPSLTSSRRVADYIMKLNDYNFARRLTEEALLKVRNG